MSSRGYRPARKLRSEIFPLALVFALAISVMGSFPTEAFRFVPAPHPPRSDRPAFAFIELPREVEARLLAAARASWQVDADGVKRMRAELITPTLPPAVLRQVAKPEDRAEFVRIPDATYRQSFLPVSAAALSPVQIPAEEGSADASVFPKAELLNLDFNRKGTNP